MISNARFRSCSWFTNFSFNISIRCTATLSHCSIIVKVCSCWNDRIINFLCPTRFSFFRRARWSLRIARRFRGRRRFWRRIFILIFSSASKRATNDNNKDDYDNPKPNSFIDCFFGFGVFPFLIKFNIPNLIKAYKSKTFGGKIKFL